MTDAALEDDLPQIKTDEHGRRIYVPGGPTLRDFIADDSRVAIIQGPIGSGTSSACCMRIWKHATQQRKSPTDGLRKSRWAIVRNTFPDLKSTTVKTWLDWFPEHLYGRFLWERPFRHDFKVDDIRLEAFFMSLDSDDDIKKLRSLELTGVWFNEAEFTSKSIFDEAETRTGRYPAMKDGGSNWSGVIADMNAPPEDHWVPLMRGDIPVPEHLTEEEAQEFNKPDDWAFFVQPPGLLEVKNEKGVVTGYKENPRAENRQWLQPNYYMKKAQGKPKTFIDSKILNKIGVVRDGDPVFKRSWNESVHMASGPLRAQKGTPIIVGLDFGRRPAAVLLQNIRSRWYVIDELLGKDMGAVSFAPILSAHLDTHYQGFDFVFYGDPSGEYKGEQSEQTAYQIFRSHGMIVQKAPGNHNDPNIRIEAMEHALSRMVDGYPAVMVSSNCRIVKTAFNGGYHYKRLKVSGAPKYHTVPDKSDHYSDVMDALMYAVLGGGEGRAMVGRSQRKPNKINAMSDYKTRKGHRRRRPTRRRVA